MRTKINLALFGFLVIALGIVLYSCDNSVTGDPVYKGKIQGWVYDDSTKLPLSGVKVRADGISDTLYTDLIGNFHYTNISMPRGEFVYYLIFQKAAYQDTTAIAIMKSDIETRIDSVFMKKPF